MNLRVFVLLAVPLVYLFLFVNLMQRLGSGDRVAVRLKSIEDLDILGLAIPEEELNPPSFLDRVIKPKLFGASRLISSNIPIDEETQSQLAMNLKLAGLKISPQIYIGLVILCGLALMVPLGLLFQLLGVLIAALGTYAVSRYLLMYKITQRRKTIENSLPDTLDLLSSCVSAGLGFDQGLLHVIKRTDGPLAEELSQAQREISMGVPRAEALGRFAKRCDSQPVTSFVGAILQAERLGVPIANILETQAESVRDYHRQQIEEESAKLPIKMLFPLVFLIFPLILIVLLGPALLKIITSGAI